jgi:hypothetical protein
MPYAVWTFTPKPHHRPNGCLLISSFLPSPYAGVTFPDKKEFTEWQHFQAEAAKRDHRAIGIKQVCVGRVNIEGNYGCG